jgi:hypothetical protein
MYKFELERYTACYIYKEKKYVFTVVLSPQIANPQRATSAEGGQI